MALLNDTIDHVANEMQQFTFNSIDYTVFVVMLCVSAGIGVYFGFFAKSADTTDEYLMGSKKMKTIPIAISLVASQLSGISIMTIPAEMYSFGINWCFSIVCVVIVIAILYWIVVPVFYTNNISNCYEYLEMRFNRKTRQLLTFSFVATLILMLPVYIFIPSLAFAQVTGVNIHLINTICCAICIFYTMFGGIKAVVWTDVFQAGVMVLSVTLVGILGAVRIGGLGEVLRIAKEGHRLDIDLTFDTTTRATLWNCFTNGTLAWTTYVGFNQSCVQRMVSLPTLAQAKRTLVYFGAGLYFIMFFNCFAGISMYARYHDCDPIAAGYVTKPDKLMPFFVQDVMGHITGMSGIFISCVFSAALSTVSACVNSLAGIVYFDYIKPHIKHTETKANLIMKSFVFVAGVYCILGGTVVETFTSILQTVYSIGGVTYGAVFGVFMMGMLFPKAHGRAVFWALVTSMATMFIIVVVAQGKLHYDTLPSSVAHCPATNISSQSTANSTIYQLKAEIPHNESFNIFQLSFNWYLTLGTAICLVVGIPLSYILEPEKDAKFNRELLAPVAQRFMSYDLTQAEEMPDIMTKKPLKT